MHDLIRTKIKKIVKLQYIIETDNLNYNSTAEKFIILVNIHYLLFFKGYA